MSLNTLGWLGAVCFAICGLPQAIQSYKQKHSDGISSSFLLLWGTGEILTLIYIFPKKEWPIIFNLVFNLLFIGVIVRFKLWPNRIGKNK